jgi:DNA repair protein RadB
VLLGGGLESGIITRVYGEAGSGKTNFCLQAARQCVSSGKKVAYIDTEGVSVERIKQLCVEYDHKKILRDILFFTPDSFESQEQMVCDAIAAKGVGLIIIDTITMFYRLNLEQDKESAIRSFTRQITNLQVAARQKDLFVIITEQVYTDKAGEVKPFTNRDAEHMTKTILRFDRKVIGQREATIIKHRSQPEGKKVCFQISAVGLV